MLVFFILIFFNLFFFFLYKNISKIINIFDYPNKIRKFHTKPVPLLGGVILCANYFLFLIFGELKTNNEKIVILLSMVFFIIGLIDDKYDIKYLKKILIQCIILVVFFLICPQFIISTIKIYTYNFEFDYIYSIFLTVLCILLFLNALNMFDGINLQSLSYIFFILAIFLVKSFFLHIVLITFIPLLLIIYLNYKNKIFMGDSGIFLISIIISMLFILAYKNNNINADEIFLLMMIPGLDMFRLFIQRILGKKNPFKSDRKHIHHLILNKFTYNKTLLMLILLFSTPYLFSYFFISYYVIISYIIIYLFLIISLQYTSARG